MVKKERFSNKIKMYVTGSEENKDRNSGTVWLTDRE